MTGLLDQLQHYKKEWLANDMVAGITVAAVTIPVCMGYAQIAGLPPVYGLYAAIIPAIVYTFFASSRRVMFGTDAVIVTMIGPGLAVAAGADPSLLPIAASICAAIIGVLFFILSILKLGGVARYLSKPTMNGFISGLAVTIIISQLPKIAGVSVDASKSLAKLGQLATQLGDVNGYSLFLGILTIAALLISRKWFPKFPATIITLLAFTAITVLFSLNAKGLAIVGTVPSGLIGFHIPWMGWEEFTYLISVCLATTVVVFADSLLTARSFALQHKDTFDDDQELRSIGIANMVGGFFGAMPGSDSASRGAAAQAAGMRTQLTQIIAALTITAVLVFFDKLLYYMPTSVLAAIVVVAVISLLNVSTYAQLFKSRRQEFWIMAITALSVIVLGTLPGVLISLAISIFDFFLRSSKPPQAILGQVAGKKGLYDVAVNSLAKPVPGIIIYRFGAPLFFANHDVFEEKVLSLASQKGTQAIVISAEAITDIDTTAADGLREVTRKLESKHIPLYFVGLIDSARQQLAAYEIGIPPHRMYKTAASALVELKKEGILK
jgi:high affinity sulfate transporter 1